VRCISTSDNHICDYCGGKIAGRGKRVLENPFYQKRYFCSEECKIKWIFKLQKEKEPVRDQESTGENRTLVIEKIRQKINEIKELVDENGQCKRWENGNRPMRLISVNLLEPSIECINLFILLGMYPHRAEAIRRYVIDGIKNDLVQFDLFNRFADLSFERLHHILELKENSQDEQKILFLKDGNGGYREVKVIEILE